MSEIMKLGFSQQLKTDKLGEKRAVDLTSVLQGGNFIHIDPKQQLESWKDGVYTFV